MTPHVDDQHWARPGAGARGSGTGALVVAGSSGRLDAARADRLAAAGATALAVRWFGGVDQPPVPAEVPLETFTGALDLLAAECDRLAVVGLSYGAEAALLTAVRDPRVSAVVALAPTDVVWEGFIAADDDPPRSKWTWAGEPVPFVPLDRAWVPARQPPSYVDHYRQSRDAAPPRTVMAATIDVERIAGAVVVVAGGDDQVWPSQDAALAIARRRSAHGLVTTVVVDPQAGHPVVLPGEPVGDATRPYRVGGDRGAPQRIGALAWPAIKEALGLERA